MTSTARNVPGYRFGSFAVDMRAGELRKHGVRIALQEKPLRILEELLRNAGAVVTRDDLRKLLWPGAMFVDFDHGINIAVSKLRRALGDSGANPRFIETLARNGYRFIAPVQRGADPGPVSNRLMLVVLPFHGDTGQAYFEDGLTEEMIAQLGRLNPRRLGVIARMTAMHYKDMDLRADQIGRELGVDYIVEGSVRESAGRVRITARLIQVSDQTQLWAEAYDRKLSDILDIQRNVTRRIARALAVELLPAEQAALSHSPSRNTLAYEAYLKGCHFWSRRTEDSHARAMEYFEKAIHEDPECALAYAGLADVYHTLGLFSAVPAGMARRKSTAAALRALELDHSLAEAHTALAYGKALYEWDWESAEREFETAIELNDNYVTAHQWYGHLLAMTSRFDEALQQLERALHLDPLSLVAGSHKGWILYLARRFEEAVLTLERTLEIDSGFALGSYFLGLARLRSAQPEAAIAAFEQADRISPDHPGVLSALVQAYARTGSRSEALRCLAVLEQLAATRYVSPYFSACAQIELRDFDHAIGLLEVACRERCPWMAYVSVDPAIDPVRADPRIRALMSWIGF